MKFCAHTLLLELAKLLNEDTTGSLDHVRLTDMLEKAKLDTSPGRLPIVVVDVSALLTFEDAESMAQLMKAYEVENLSWPREVKLSKKEQERLENKIRKIAERRL